MKENKLLIFINKTPTEVFDYILNANNIVKWLPSIKYETSTDVPYKLGTIVKDYDYNDNLTEFYISDFKRGEIFTFDQIGSNYHVTYKFKEVGSGTQLEYFEWVDENELSDPFTLEPLELLKKNLEEQI